MTKKCEKLTLKQQAFVAEYLKSGNATGAVKAAGYQCKSDKAAGVVGARLLGTVSVQGAIKAAKEKVMDEAIVDAAFVLNGLKEIAIAGMVQVPKRDIEGNQEVDKNGQPAYRMIDAPSATGALKTLAQCIGLGKDKDEKDAAITTLAETLNALVNKQ